MTRIVRRDRSMPYTIRKRLTLNRQSPFRSRSRGDPADGFTPIARRAALTGRLMSGGRWRRTSATCGGMSSSNGSTYRERFFAGVRGSPKTSSNDRPLPFFA